MKNHRIQKVLIANRGEIARRIQAVCRQLGKSSVSIASEADKDSLFAQEAEQLIIIGPSPAKDSYLAAEKIIRTAKETGCDAIHPGYGFLSENAEFAQMVEEAGLCFIGPSSDAIRALGDKVSARREAHQVQVPTTAGSFGGLSDEDLIDAAHQVGFPVIIKAVAGGGGRGMRIVSSSEEMKEILPRARAEAKKNFANDDVYFERFIEDPRHVEVQIFGDKHGNLVHLGTRDCSTQRRHQKLVEEAPAPFLPNDLREKIQDAAVRVAKRVGYSNAGTAEFLVKGEDFYFLEMNTRIQVEHPVTELITGLDLIALQIHVAEGTPLPFTQEQISFRGHAIEYRLYAENPGENFAPTKGRIDRFSYPEDPCLRVDSGYTEGMDVSLFYDAMLSKIIVYEETREAAVLKSESLLREFSIEGLTTNIDFHRWLLRLSSFRSHPLTIHEIEKIFSAESLVDLRKSDRVDPKHRSPVEGAVFIDHLSYASKRFSTQYGIELLHEEDKTFLAIPFFQGKAAKASFCRRSNSQKEVMKALIEEVLEAETPEAIFP